MKEALTSATGTVKVVGFYDQYLRFSHDLDGDKSSALWCVCLFVTPPKGADHDTRYRSVVTSYDYDAPLSEAGDPTEKLLAIRDVIKQVPLSQLPPTKVDVLITLVHMPNK